MSQTEKIWKFFFYLNLGWGWIGGRRGNNLVVRINLKRIVWYRRHWRWTSLGNNCWCIQPLQMLSIGRLLAWITGVVNIPRRVGKTRQVVLISAADVKSARYADVGLMYWAWWHFLRVQRGTRHGNRSIAADWRFQGGVTVGRYWYTGFCIVRCLK